MLFLLSLLPAFSVFGWYSQLFPFNAGSYDEAPVNFNGRTWQLLDYSYVGYKLGETGLRSGIPCTIINITGTGDITAEIQTAVDTLEVGGGGRVVIPPGTFTVSSRITINRNNISIEGSGSGRTILNIPSTITLLEGANDFQGVFTFEYTMDGWNKGWPDRGAILSMVTDVIPEGSMYVTGLTNSAGVNIGDWITIQQYWWQTFVQQNSSSVWQYYPPAYNRETTFTYLRKVINKDAGGIYIDAPIPFHLDPANNPIHIRRSGPTAPSFQMLDNVGLSGVTISFADNNTGTNLRPRGAGVVMEAVVNGWLYDVKVYNFPRHGFYFEYDARISFINCSAKKTQDYGGDGYGYGYHNYGSQNILINNCYAEDVRHAYIFQKPLANYCVVANSESVDCRQGEDTHHSFSHAILRDNLLHKNGNKMVGYNRGTTSTNGYETYGSGVNWNVTGDGIGGVYESAIFSMNPASYPAPYTHGIMVGGPGDYRVFDNGSHISGTYVEGDLIPAAAGLQVGPNGDRNELYEGIGQAGLQPSSLYMEQLTNRLGTVPAVWDITCGGGPSVPVATPFPATGPNHLIFNSENAAWGINFGSACPLPLNTLTPGTNLDDYGQAHSSPEGLRVDVTAGSNWTPMAVFGGPDLNTSSYLSIEMWIYPSNAAMEFYFNLLNDDAGTTLGGTVTVNGTYAQGGTFVINTWNRVTVPISAFAYSGVFSGIRLARTANAPGTFYMDDMYLILNGTPTFTSTPTRTNTQGTTFTFTRTATPTSSRTMTSTPVNTGTFTPASTATHTRTMTPGNTATYTYTATNTSTNIPGSTNTFTATSTPTRTMTSTPTVTFTATTGTSLLIDNFEDNNFAANARTGTWYDIADGGTSNVTKSIATDVPAGGGSYSGTFSGTVNGAAGAWPSIGIGTNLNAAATAEDLGAYSGITAQMKGVAGTGSAVTYRIQLVSSNITDYSYWYFTWTPNAAWNLYNVAWTSFTSPGWGQGNALTIAQILPFVTGINFMVADTTGLAANNAGSTWFVDNLNFMNPSTPTFTRTNTPYAGSPTNTPTITPTTAMCKRFLAYYPYWVPGYKQDKIPYNKLTHICHAFVQPQANGSLVAPGGFMEPALLTNAHANGVKVLVSIGGADETARLNFVTIAASPALRTAFADAVEAFCRTNNYDGADIDWEFPQDATQRANQNLLIQAVRDKFNASAAPAPSWEISMAITPGNWTGQWNDYTVLKTIVSFFNLMNYDYHGGWSPHSGHNAALYQGTDPTVGEDIDWTNTYITVTRGVPASMLNLGLAFYGYRFPNSENIYDNCGGDCNPGTVQMNYTAITPLIGAGWTYNYDAGSQVPYLRYDAGAGFVTYDNPASIANKVNYALASKNYGGIFMWEITGDYSAGSQPLLDSMYAAYSAVCGVVTPTNTFTASPSPIAQSPSNTPTRTQTYTATSTRTATSTVVIPSPTYTATAAYTQTLPPTSTYTGTSTFTRTVSPTFTESMTHTVSPTDTPYAGTPTDTPTITVTQTTMPSETDTPVPSETDTPEPTQNDTATSTLTETLMPTDTQTALPSVTVTDTPVSTPAVSPTYTQTFSVNTVTNTPMPSATATFTLTRTMTNTPASTAVNTPINTPVNTPVDTLVSTATQTPVDTSTYTPTLTATPATATPTVTLTPAAVPTSQDYKVTDPLVYPNPYNPDSGSLTIVFDITKNTVSMGFKLYTVSGRLVRSDAVPVNLTAGTKSVTFTNTVFTQLSQGVYFYYLLAESDTGDEARSAIEKLVIIR